MVLHRSVLKEGNILCKYADTRSDVSDNNNNDILYSDNDMLTTISWKQMRPSATVFTSDSEMNKNMKKVVNQRALMIKQMMCGVKLIKKTKQ